jgi:poly(ADP-ribose) glycohydrolase ARH3
MRVAPIGLMFHHDEDRLWDQARLSSLPTHVHPLGIEGAQLIALSIAICLNSHGIDKSNFLADLRRRAETAEFQRKLETAESVASREDLLGLGNDFTALDSVVTAVSCFLLWSDSYEESVSNAILLGGDTDTIAAMVGAIAGAHLGIRAIPSDLTDRLEDDHKGRGYIVELAKQLATSQL